MVSGELDLQQLKRWEDAEVTGKACLLPRSWSVDCTKFPDVRSGRPNLFPLADIGLQNALKQLWGMDRKPTKDEMLACYPNWSPYLSYAALYLWRSIE